MNKRKREKQLERINSHLNGTGSYLFENITRSDLVLPKTSSDGKTVIPPGGKFRGDSYFCSLHGQVSVISNLQEVTNSLITEQPPTVTSTGKVESFLNDKQEDDGVDILLTEDPIDSVMILND